MQNYDSTAFYISPFQSACLLANGIPRSLASCLLFVVVVVSFYIKTVYNRFYGNFLLNKILLKLLFPCTY